MVHTGVKDGSVDSARQSFARTAIPIVIFMNWGYVLDSEALQSKADSHQCQDAPRQPFRAVVLENTETFFYLRRGVRPHRSGAIRSMKPHVHSSSLIEFAELSMARSSQLASD